MNDPYQADAHHVTVDVGWALLGKHPGTDRDYSILASSAEPLSEPEFASVVRHFMPGTPPTERDRPDSLPWVTISRVRVEEQVYLGIAIMDRDPAGQVDMARRPITRTSYFCIRYLESPEVRISYYGLYQALDGIELPYPNNDLIPLPVPLLDPASAAAHIRSFGEPMVRAAAARLLDGPVSILGAENSTLEVRLRFLDAVASMLPYGYRASFSAASWSDSGARHPIRLAFAARPRHDAGVVKWRSEPGPATGIGEEYSGLIKQVLYRPEGEQPAGQPDPLTALVGCLAADSKPYGFDQPRQACARVRDFGLPFIVWDEIRAKTAKTADVRAAVRHGRFTELPWAGRRALLIRLFFSGEADDWGLIREWLAQAGDAEAALLDMLTEACYEQIWTPRPSMASKISEYLGLAYEYRLLDDLMARLAEPPASREDLTGGLRAAAQALADGLSRIPDVASFPRTGAVLAKNPLVACALLAHLAGVGPVPGGVVSWLTSIDQELFAPFSIVLGRTAADARQSEIERLAGCDEECVRALLDTASYTGRLDRVLPAFAAWLWRTTLVSGGRHRGAARDWCKVTEDLDGRTVATKAWLDLVLLICRSPRFLREQRDLRGWRRYNEHLVEDWEVLATHLDPAFDEAVTDTLADYLENAGRADATAQFGGMEDLVGRLTTGDRRQSLWQSIEEIRPPAGRRRRSTPDMRELAETQEEDVLPPEQPLHRWKAPSHEWPPPPAGPPGPPEPEHGERPHLASGQDTILSELSRLQPGATFGDIVRPCIDALNAQVDPFRTGRALAGSRAIDSGQLAAEVIGRLRYHLGISPEKNNSHAGEWLRSLVECFGDGTMFDPRVAQDFTEAGGRHIVYGLHLDLRCLQAIPPPPDRLRQVLQGLENELAQLRQLLPEGEDPADPAPQKKRLLGILPARNQEKKARSQEGEPG